MLHPVTDIHRFLYGIQRHYLADSDRSARLLHSSHRIHPAKEDSWSSTGVRAFQTRQMGYPRQPVLASLSFLCHHLDAVPDDASGNRTEYELRRTDLASHHFWR